MADNIDQPAARFPTSTSRGRGRGNGGRGKGRGRGNQAPHIRSESLPVGEAPPPPPKPNAVPNKGTPMRNDPLIRESALYPGMSMRPTTILPRFHTDAAGYITLVDKVHTEMCASNHRLQNQMPLPLFRYHCVQAYYARVLDITVAHGEAGTEQLSAYSRYTSLPISVPVVIHRYLQGMGDFKTANQTAFRWQQSYFPSGALIEGLPGYFGAINGATSDRYQSQIAPGVTADLCSHTVRFSLDQAANRDLPLPGGLVANIPGFVTVPTVNLLGYGTAPAIPARFITTMSNLGFDVVNGVRQRPADMSGAYCISPSVLAYCSTTIENERSFPSERITLASNAEGSLAQMPFITPVAPNTNEPTTAISSRDCFVRSVEQLSEQGTTAAFTSGFRVQRENANTGETSWCCLAFQQLGIFLPAPANFVAQRNASFNDLQANRLNINSYEAGPSNRNDVMTDVVHSLRTT